MRLTRLLPIAFVLLVLSGAVVKAQDKGRNPYFFVESDQFSAVGKWVPADPKDKNSMPQEVQIDCFRELRMCVEATAEFYVHAHVNVSYPKILQWDTNGIVARDDEGVCMSRTIVVSFAEKSISATYSPKTTTEKVKQACQFFGAKGTEAALFVVKGTKRWEELDK
jgi:hypothetical protein